MKYAIHCEPHFYAGDIFGQDKPHLLRGYRSDGRMIVFRTRKDADTLAAMLNDHGDGVYVLAPNQYAPPEYSVVDYRGKSGVLTLEQAMIECGLEYDFNPDGTRVTLTEAQLFEGAPILPTVGQ